MQCAVVHIKRGVQRQGGVQVDERSMLTSLKDGTPYRFLETLESLRQNNKVDLNTADYLQSMSIK